LTSADNFIKLWNTKVIHIWTQNFNQKHSAHPLVDWPLHSGPRRTLGNCNCPRVAAGWNGIYIGRLGSQDNTLGTLNLSHDCSYSQRPIFSHTGRGWQGSRFLGCNGHPGNRPGRHAGSHTFSDRRNVPRRESALERRCLAAYKVWTCRRCCDTREWCLERAKTGR
jgi:hypothetical protein